MNEYITKEDARLVRPEYREMIDDFSAGFNISIDEYIDRIDEIPAADVAPIKHGKWRCWYRSLDDSSYFRCSCCDSDVIGYKKYNYCPNCGAKMDGDKYG